MENKAVNTLWILRGVSGAGKTSLANVLSTSLEDCDIVSADDYFYTAEEGYNFDKQKLGNAHSYCKNRVLALMEENYSNIVVHNTTTTEKELQPYLDMASEYNYKVVCLVVENYHNNKSVHNVPDLTLLKQAGNLRNSIKLIGNNK